MLEGGELERGAPLDALPLFLLFFFRFLSFSSFPRGSSFRKSATWAVTIEEAPARSAARRRVSSLAGSRSKARTRPLRPTRADFEKERVFFFRFRREGFVFSSRGQFKRASLDEKKAVKSSGQRMSE